MHEFTVNLSIRILICFDFEAKYFAEHSTNQNSLKMCYHKRILLTRQQ